MSLAKKMLTRKEAADYLGLKPQTLACWAMSGKHLPFVRCGRAIRYRLADIERFIERRTVGVSGGLRD